MQCYRGSFLFPSTATTSLEHEHMGRHKGLPSLGTPALTFSRLRRAHFCLSLRGCPLAPSINTWPLWILPGWFASSHSGLLGDRGERGGQGCFTELWAARWRGEGKWHRVRNRNHPTVSTRSLQLCLSRQCKCFSDLGVAIFQRREASGGMPRRNKTACQSQPHWKSWFYSLLHNQLWVVPYAICY